MLTIQPFSYTDEEYLFIATIEAEIFGDQGVSIDEWRHYDQSRNPDYPFQRDLIRRDGTVLGFGEYGQNPSAYHPQKYYCTIYVDPAQDAPDIRPAYLTHVLEALQGRDVIALTSGMLESKSEAMRFFADHGFQEIGREQLSNLDVTTFEAQRFAPALERVRAAGIEIVALRDLQMRDPDWQRKLYDLDTTVSRDIPSIGEKREHPFESWKKSRLEGPTFDPDGWFVALDGDQYVGECEGSVMLASDEFQNGVTGVRREYRRRGLATALKVHLITYARQRGVRQIVTNNASHNPMYQLNLQLGFQPQPAWIRVEKTLVRQPVE
jgi:GNAT superfamily N-acetyltransferase